MNDAVWELQCAIYRALSRSGKIRSLVGNPPRIYDDPPRDMQLSCIRIGSTGIAPWQGVPGGFEHEIRLYAYSYYHGSKEVKNIMDRVHDTLHEKFFDINGHRLVDMRFVFADIIHRPESGLYSGIMRYRAVTQTEILQEEENVMDTEV